MLSVADHLEKGVVMRISDMPEFKDKSNILTMSKDTPLIEAVKAMVQRNCGSVVIVQDRQPVGIFTERDLLNKVVGQNKDASILCLRDVMTVDIKTAHAEDGVAVSMRRMSQGRFRHLPIVDQDGNLVGLLSQGDFVAYTWGNLWSQFSHKTKTSFMTNTQLWMLLLGPLVYLVFVKLLFMSP